MEHIRFVHRGHRASPDGVVKTGGVVNFNGPIDRHNAARLYEGVLDAFIATPTQRAVNLAAVSSNGGLDVILQATDPALVW